MAADGNVDRTRLRMLSKALLGSRYQAEVGAAIADAAESVWGADLLEALGRNAPTKGLMSSELDRLQRVELLVPVDESSYDRRKLLRPVDPEGAYWTLCQELRRATKSG